MGTIVPGMIGLGSLKMPASCDGVSCGGFANVSDNTRPARGFAGTVLAADESDGMGTTVLRAPRAEGLNFGLLLRGAIGRWGRERVAIDLLVVSFWTGGVALTEDGTTGGVMRVGWDKARVDGFGRSEDGDARGRVAGAWPAKRAILGFGTSEGL
jgi:hypothetical protein